MTRLLLYWVEDDGESRISDAEWAGIEDLQRQTNLREYLHRGRVGFLRSTYEPRWPQLYPDSALPESMSVDAVERHLETLVDRGWTWEELVRCRLAARVPSGAHGADFLLAGHSEVSDLRGDILLVLRFLLRASVIAPRCAFHVAIDGGVKVPDLLVIDGQIRPDPRALEDQLQVLWEARDAEGAVDLLEAAESGDYLAPATGPARVGGEHHGRTDLAADA